MKNVISVACLFVLVVAAAAQERVPQEDAVRFAKIFAENAAKLSDAPIKTDVDPDQPFAMKKGERAAMVIPDRKLSAEALAKADKEVIPVGQLWLRNLSPAPNGKAAPNDSLRIVTITENGQDHHLPLLFLGASKNAAGQLELLVYAKDKEPLVKLPLEHVKGETNLPIEFEARKGDDTGVISLNILGKYRTELKVAEQEP